VWTLDQSDGELLVRTGVSGRAARVGHRLTIAVRQWQATVSWSGKTPTAAELTAEVQSLAVLRGDGGVKALSGPEKALARANALRSLDADRFPQIRYAAEVIDASSDGYRLTGTLHIHGRSRRHVVHLRVADAGASWRLSTNSEVRQSDFGVTPYSLLLGSIKVEDRVTVSFAANRVRQAPESLR
jgi:polyisoprenoid-binding protein YceI